MLDVDRVNRLPLSILGLAAKRLSMSLPGNNARSLIPAIR